MGTSRSRALALFILAVTVIVARAGHAAGLNEAKSRKAPLPELSLVTGACTDQEDWTMGQAIPDGVASTFASSMKSDESLRSALFEIASLLRAPRATERWSFGQYWLGRLYRRQGLPQLAYVQFASIPKAHLADASKLNHGLGVQMAALDCINHTVEETPSLPPPSINLMQYASVVAQLPANKITPLYDAAFLQIKWDLKRLGHASKPSPLIGLLAKSPAHQGLALGYIAAESGDFDTASRELARGLAVTPSTGWFIEHHRNHALLLAGRVQYSIGQSVAATKSFKSITKDSNLLIEGLSDLSWSHLRSGSDQGAIGTAVSLDSASLHSVFVPETHVVGAIAYYELCRYPQAYEMLTSFRREYTPAYKWLRNWYTSVRSQKTTSGSYDLAVRFLRSQDGVPTRIGTELVRSPIFLAAQSEINQLIAAQKKIPQMKIGGFPFWYRPAEKWMPEIAARRKSLVAKVERDLRRRMVRMLRDLDAVGINAEILEAETLREAGDDVIYRNINPGFSEFARNQRTSVKKPAGTTFWDWGTNPSGKKGAELWQDELGSFQAATGSLCNSHEEFQKSASND